MSENPAPDPVGYDSRIGPKLSGLALTSMIVGIASIPLVCVLGIGVVSGIAAVVLGIIALVSINKNAAALRGKGFAITGIATGGLCALAVPLLMVAILLPALNKARAKAKSIVCLTNLKSIALASVMYQGDNSGIFPAAGDGTPRDEDWLFWQASRDPKKGALVPYMAGTFPKKAYLCPTDPGGRPATVNQYSYSANVNIYAQGRPPAPGAATRPIRYSSITSPSTKILLIEEDSASIDDAAWEPHLWVPGSPTNNPATYHGPGTAAASFADGHAELVPTARALSPTLFDPYVP